MGRSFTCGGQSYATCGGQSYGLALACFCPPATFRVHHTGPGVSPLPHILLLHTSLFSVLALAQRCTAHHVCRELLRVVVQILGLVSICQQQQIDTLPG